MVDELTADDAFKLDEAVALLERTPAVLSALLGGLPESWLQATEGEGTWSPFDVVAHLVYSERVNWLPRARHILAGENRPFEPFDRTGFIVESRGQSSSELLAAFAELRRENVAVLMAMALTGEDLRRTGLHPEFGEVRLEQLLATWVVHDLTHLAQVTRTMAKRYGEAVGPWDAYLSILRERA